MPTNRNDHQSDLDTEIQVHLSEYEKIRDEVVYQMGSASQSLLLSLSSASIILPLLFTQIDNISSIVLGAFLYVLAIVYAVIGMHYATANYYVNVNSNYIQQSLAPKVNLRLHTTTKNQVLQGENFQRNTRRSFAALYLSTAGAVATSLIILLPSLLSLIFAHYVVLLSPVPTPQPILALQFVSSFLLPLSIASLVFFILSCLSLILGAVFALRTSFIINRKEENK
jgi:hypothetical protein